MPPQQVDRPRVPSAHSISLCTNGQEKFQRLSPWYTSEVEICGKIVIDSFKLFCYFRSLIERGMGNVVKIGTVRNGKFNWYRADCGERSISAGHAKIMTTVQTRQGATACSNLCSSDL